MRKSYVWSNVGAIMLFLGAMMVIPAAIGRYYAETEYVAFLYTAGGTVLIGAWLCYYCRPVRKNRKRLQMKDGYALVTYSWLIAVLMTAVLYLASGMTHSVSDAFFEAASGFTMTGATILYEVEAQARCILLWRSMTQWLGGMGVLVLFVALLNGQNQGSLQLFRADGLGTVRQKLHPKLIESALGLVLAYLIHTVLVVILYKLCGMGLFDALNHGLTVISTGGFSTKSAGIGAFQSASIEWVTIFAMILTGCNYTLFIHAWNNRSLRTFKDSLELRAYLAVLLLASLAVIWFILPEYDGQWMTAVRHGVFHVVSIVTTAGFVLFDGAAWPHPVLMLLVLLMLCGSCAGSVGGSVKIDRHIILLQKARQEIRRFLHPNLVTRLKSNHQLLDDEVVLSVNMFFYIFIIMTALGTAVLSMCGVELSGALTASLSCLGGIGPAMNLGGSALYYGALPSACKWVLAVLMLVGRLEVYAILVVIHPFHKKIRENERAQMLESLEKDGMIEPFVREYD